MSHHLLFFESVSIFMIQTVVIGIDLYIEREKNEVCFVIIHALIKQLGSLIPQLTMVTFPVFRLFLSYSKHCKPKGK